MAALLCELLVHLIRVSSVLIRGLLLVAAVRPNVPESQPVWCRGNLRCQLDVADRQHVVS